MTKIININNVRQIVETDNPVIYRYAFNGSKWRRFELMQEIKVEINGVVLTVPKGFMWDLASVPAFFWWLLKPFGIFDLAYMLHDIAYQLKGKIKGTKIRINKDGKKVEIPVYMTLSRKQCDDLMLQWALEIAGTKKVSLRNIDCYVRYYGVRAFGWVVWNKKEKE
jgi:hypothetical protein